MGEEHDLTGMHGAEVFRTLATGLRLALTGGAIGEVVANPGDGAYLLVRILDCPQDASRVGAEEVTFFTDVESVLDAREETHGG